jgi:predicted MFS family arabinose efflux permease
MKTPSIVRPIALLSAAAFVSVATMRVGDPLLPQVANEFHVSPGDASVIATAFALAYGLCQLVYGALGDRFGKYRLVAIASLVSALTVGSAGLAHSLAALGVARLAAGASAAAIVPLSMAFIGDHVAYENRQTILAYFLSGTILGAIGGQVLGGVLGELIGWRAPFLFLGALFLLIGILLVVELRSPRIPPPVLTRSISPASLVNGYVLLLRRPWVRIVLITVFIEGFLFYGAFTYVGAWLHDGFGLDYATVGLFLGFMGLGGLLYLAIAAGRLSLMAPALVLLGLGLYMLHNTLQTNATQMAPETRGLAVSTFANALFLGQAGGVWLCGLAVDRAGFAPVFLASGAALVLLGAAFAFLLRRRPV